MSRKERLWINQSMNLEKLYTKSIKIKLSQNEAYKSHIQSQRKYRQGIILSVFFVETKTLKCVN